MKTKTKQPKFDVPFTDTSYEYKMDNSKDVHQKVGEWKLGDWCICEMEIKQVTGVDRDTLVPQALSCGYFKSGCSDWTDRMFPLTLRNKNIATYFKNLYDELHKTNRNLNFPDLNRYFCDKCVETLNAKTEEETRKLCEEIRQFQESIIESCKDVMRKNVNGVALFR